MSRSIAPEILRLALPALLTLVAEPLFLLADTAIVGRLGTTALAGLAVAATALLTIQYLFVFLAYATTASVARKIGAGDERAALQAGIDGLWLAVLCGVLVAIPVGLFARSIVALFGASAESTTQAASYLATSAWGLPAMLIVLAATGIFRGFQDTATPLLVSLCGFGSNIVLNAVFVLVLRWGVAGSAAGTVLAQTGMACWLLVVALRRAHRLGVSWRPLFGGVWSAARSGTPLLLRTGALRLMIIIQTWVAASGGDVVLGAHQVIATMWGFLALALDALAIAAQALTGKALGEGDATVARRLVVTLMWWGLAAGCVLGMILAGLHRVLPMIFTSDEATATVVGWGLITIALLQPLCGLVFVLDGVLIGAGDARWLAGAMMVCAAIGIPALLVAQHLATAHTSSGTVIILWLAFGVFMAARAATLWYRQRTDHWFVLGDVCRTD